MEKKDVTKEIIATPTMRQQASLITAGRKHAKSWKKIEDDNKNGIRDAIGGEDVVNVRLVTEDGDEVAVIVQGDVPEQAVDWPEFRKAHPELEKEFEKFLKPAADPRVTIYTGWVEKMPTQAPNEPSA